MQGVFFLSLFSIIFLNSEVFSAELCHVRRSSPSDILDSFFFYEGANKVLAVHSMIDEGVNWVEYAYDSNGNLVQKRKGSEANDYVTLTQVDYDSKSRRTERRVYQTDEDVPSMTIRYDYDGIGRLTEERQTWSDRPGIEKVIHHQYNVLGYDHIISFYFVGGDPVPFEASKAEETPAGEKSRTRYFMYDPILEEWQKKETRVLSDSGEIKSSLEYYADSDGNWVLYREAEYVYNQDALLVEKVIHFVEYGSEERIEYFYGDWCVR